MTRNTLNKAGIIAMIVFWMMTNVTSEIIAQQVCEDSKQEITLSDGSCVLLYKAKENNGAPRIYYLPTQIRISKNKGIPELSYQEYTKDGSTSPDGALLHLLITWGLTEKQLEEVSDIVRQTYGKSAVLAGALYLDEGSFEISSTTSIGQILNKSLSAKGHPLTMAGGKMALSFHIPKARVGIFGKAIKKRSEFSDTAITLTYKYKTYTCNYGLNTAMTKTIKLKGYLKNWF